MFIWQEYKLIEHFAMIIEIPYSATVAIKDLTTNHSLLCYCLTHAQTRSGNIFKNPNKI